MHTSKVAAVSEVRQALIKRQRDFIAPPGLVADGRDMGTFIFPEANIKFFITASIEERAKRRYKQLQKNNINVNINDLFLQISNRDKSDAEREDSPLRQASDAIYIDTTDLTIDEVVSEAFAVIKSKGLSA